MREKLSARLQMPMTLIVTLCGAQAFLLQNYKYHTFSGLMYSFWVLIVVSFALLMVTICYFVRSWWNHTYSFLPSAQVNEDYRQSLIEFYKTCENGEQLAAEHFTDYLRTHYICCSAANTVCNDIRSVYLHKTNGMLIITAICTVGTFLVFSFGSLGEAL
ncbi:hypothetical protein [Nitrosospira multiformis]|nr:hypothetical protein [Nitrosospira multiformis]